MRKNIIAISLIVSFLMVVIHEMIPHHHHIEDDMELFSHQNHDHHQGTNSETDHTSHFPFPAHQHVSASEGFDLVRVSTNLEREITSPICFLIPSYLSRVPEDEPPKNTFYSVFTSPLNSLPFIISPNAMRGSPCFV